MRTASAAFTLGRLERWGHGERAALWDDARVRAGRLRASEGNDPSAEQKAARAMSLAAAGLDRKACAALLAQGTLPLDAITAEKLRVPYPRGAAVS